MNKKFSTAAAAFALAFAAAGSAHAAGSNVTDNIYGFASIGQQRFSDDTGNVDKSTNQLKLGVGYQFNRFVGAELAWQQGGHRTILPGVKLDVEGFSLAAKGRYPVVKDLDVTAKVGVAMLKSQLLNATLHDTRPVYGFGVEYKVSKALAVTADYDVVNKAPGLASDLKTFSVGLKHSF